MAKKVAKHYYFVSGVRFHLIGMQKYIVECLRIFKHQMVHKGGKYLHPVSILIKIGVVVRKKCVQKCLFFNRDLKIRRRRMSATAVMTEGDWEEVAVARRENYP